MSWGAPAVCGCSSAPFVAGLPLLAWWLRRRASERFGTEENLAALQIGRPAGFRAARAVLRCSASCSSSWRSRGRSTGRARASCASAASTWSVVLDFSRACSREMCVGATSERAKAELTRLLGDPDGDRVGIVAFAGETMNFP